MAVLTELPIQSGGQTQVSTEVHLASCVPSAALTFLVFLYCTSYLLKYTFIPL